ncbi:hypothetical protein D8S78_04370 [Natrialba swarupiae]|nr:hypothetical protein [Natrialba swarupiae]
MRAADGDSRTRTLSFYLKPVASNLPVDRSATGQSSSTEAIGEIEFAVVGVVDPSSERCGYCTDRTVRPKGRGPVETG